MILSTLPLTAQVKDAGLWTSVTLEKKFTQRLDLSFTEELRFNENITELGTIFSDIGLGYKLGKDNLLGISFNYRFISRRQLNDSYSQRNRYYTDITVKKGFGMIVPILRTRFQWQKNDLFSGEDNAPDIHMRNKLTLKYDPGKQFKPFVSAEIFTQLNHRSGNLLNDNVRYAAGVDYDINEHHAFGIGYMLDREMNVKNPRYSYIVTLGYKLTL